MALEQVVLSTLVANRPGAAVVVEAFAKKNAGEARALVKRINPKYWPIPFDEQPPNPSEGEIWRMVVPVEPFLRETEWGRAYGYCSGLLHAPNPYVYLSGTASEVKDQDREQVAQLVDYSNKIQRLIKNHLVYLSEMDHSLICHVPDDPTVEPEVSVYTLRKYRK
jgi:hypothetical protein